MTNSETAKDVKRFEKKKEQQESVDVKISKRVEESDSIPNTDDGKEEKTRIHQDTQKVDEENDTRISTDDDDV